MKIKQSYHGTGSKEGYLYKWYKDNGEIMELVTLPTEVHTGSILAIEDNYYKVRKIYDCEISPEELEVVWFELDRHVFKADFNLEIKENQQPQK